MLKKFIHLFVTFIGILTLTSCTKKENLIIDFNHSYEDVEKFKIPAKETYFQANLEYFVYIYDLKCLHCERIKGEVCAYGLSEKYPLYFLEYDLIIPVGNEDEIKLNVSDIKDTYILGTPTLLQIKNKQLILNVSGDDLVLSILREFYT